MSNNNFNSMIKQTLTDQKMAMMLAKGIYSYRKENELIFVYEPDDNLWYIDMPWPDDRYNITMVSGADKLLNFISKDDRPKDKCDKKYAYVFVHPAKNPRPDLMEEGYAECVQLSSSTVGGATYKVNGLPGFTREVWISPATLLVLGHCPKYIYIKYHSFRERVLMLKLSDLNLSKRTLQIAKINRITTIKDLTNCERPDMIRMFGKRCCSELDDLLESCGLAPWQVPTTEANQPLDY